MKKYILFFIFIHIGSYTFSAEKKIILVVGPSSGVFSGMAQQMFIGVDIFEAAHPEITKEFKFVKIKTGPDLKNISESLTAAVKLYHPTAVMGGVTSSHALAISDVTESKKIPFIAPYATNPQVTLNRPLTYTSCVSDAELLNRLITLVIHEKAKRGLIVYDAKDLYSQGAAKIFKERFEIAGGQIVLMEESSISTQKLGDFDFVFIPLYQIPAVKMITKLDNLLRKNVPFYGTDGWVGGSVFSNLLPLNFTRLAYFIDHYSSEIEKTPEAKLFYQNLEKRRLEFGETKLRLNSTGSILAYDTALVLTHELSNKRLTIFSKGEKIIGVSGAYDYSKGRTPELKEVYLVRVLNNGEKVSATLRK